MPRKNYIKSAELDDFMLAEQALTDLESEQHEQEENSYC